MSHRALCRVLASSTHPPTDCPAFDAATVVAPSNNVSLPTTTAIIDQDWDVFLTSSEASSDSSYSSYGWYTVSNASAVGSLFLEITQGSYSLTQVEDIEPLEIGALFGNVGGFWGEQSEVMCRQCSISALRVREKATAILE